MMDTKIRSRSLWCVFAAATLPLALGGCDKPRATGGPTEIIVGTQQQTWDRLEEDIKAALEPRTFTVRDERVFDVAHLDPTEPGWANLRVMRHVLLIGSPEDAAVSEALSAHRGAAPAPPAVVQVRNVWAQNQLVTVAVVPPADPAESARPLLPAIGDTYLRQFEEYARARMFVAGPNQALADSLRRNYGFTMMLPQVYRAAEVEPEVFVFRNDQHHNPEVSLIRNITVASRPRGEVAPTADAASAWRAELAERLNHPPQVTETRPESHPIEASGRTGLQIHGVWSNPPGEWPAAGPFLTRLIECPDRVFLLDAWLYAPRFPKYEYMYQLNTILDSFQC
jgi:hypothetical protein